MLCTEFARTLSYALLCVTAALDKESKGKEYLKESASKNSCSSGGHCHNFQVDFSSSRLVPSSKISSRPGSKLTVMVVPSFSSAAS
jgi:hypothetical protein